MPNRPAHSFGASRRSLPVLRKQLSDRERRSIGKALVGDYDRIRDHIEHVIAGFDDFNAQIRKGVFYLPNDARDRRKFNNAEGKAKFIVSELTSHRLEPGQFLMTTVRSHDQFNTTIYGLNDRYRGVYNGRRVVFMNVEDMKDAGLQQGQLVDLTSYYKDETRVARHFMVAPIEIARRCTATYFPEANVLVSINSSADRSNTPVSKSIVISIAPSKTAAAVDQLRREATRCLVGDDALDVRVDVERWRSKKTDQGLITFTRKIHCQGRRRRN